MSEPPPGLPPEPTPPEGGSDQPAKKPSAALLALSIVTGVFAVIGIFILVGAGICVAILSGAAR